MPPKKNPVFKHRKILRDNIQGITKPAIMRMAKQGGVKSLTLYVFEEIRGIMKVMMERILQHAITVTEHARRTTVYAADIKKGIFSATGEDFLFDPKKKEIKNCKNPGKTAYNAPQKVGPGAKQRKFKSGTVAIRDIKKLQKQYDCVLCRKEPFRRLVREIAQDYKNDLRFSESAMVAMQLFVEQKIVQLFEKANLVAIHAGRTRVKPSDIQLVRRLTGERLC